jgi:hypothetical protein
MLLGYLSQSVTRFRDAPRGRRISRFAFLDAQPSGFARLADYNSTIAGISVSRSRTLNST